MATALPDGIGALATIGYQRPANLVHILLDNQVHESTGGQATVSTSVDVCGIAADCGYPQVAHPRRPTSWPGSCRRRK